MIHLPTGSPSGTSFHGVTINATPNEMIQVLGAPTYLNGDKTNIEWVRELDSADVFTVYDWKNYNGLEMDENVNWHIGGHNVDITKNARNEIMNLLTEARKNKIYA